MKHHRSALYDIWCHNIRIYASLGLTTKTSDRWISCLLTSQQLHQEEIFTLQPRILCNAVLWHVILLFTGFTAGTLQAFWCENYSQDAIIISGFSCFACYLGTWFMAVQLLHFPFHSSVMMWFTLSPICSWGKGIKLLLKMSSVM